MVAPRWLTELPRPALMAIGDSFLNGMRSMSINDTMAANSIPAFVDGSLQPVTGFTPFRRASYPFQMLIDVEEQARRYARSIVPQAALLEVLRHLSAIKADVTKHARDWLDRFGASLTDVPAQFDNLAIAGAMIPDAFSIIALLRHTLRRGSRL